MFTRQTLRKASLGRERQERGVLFSVHLKATMMKAGKRGTGLHQPTLDHAKP